ncbi:hypothetical protein [Streptomyces sp. NBC_00038]|uniref:hypothetical protein n=1 Tax=Streptomyces sp. NBC_00038 TaxID=2903615 RepID=UPI00225B61A9|nr:hypothetical protein [Streptomyces sp. NBC_00038]MCX5559951.1 hypothetical protein [Streptomyces sp. NBC_00038]
MQGDVNDLRPGEFKITDTEEAVWRQVNPAFVHDGRVSSQAFTPSAKDEGELSVNRSSKVSAQESFDHYTKVLEFPSAGVYSLTVGEISGEELSVIDDSAAEDGQPRSPGHAFIDYRSVPPKRAKKIAGRLRQKAESHDWAYRSEVAED